jgi:hypothetical protein
MKKVLLPVFAAGLVLLGSCKEKGPAIDFSDVKAIDTTYTAPVEAAQQRRVLLEEFTGVTCPNCPQAHRLIKNIQAQYPDRVIAVGYYPTGLPQSQPVEHLTIQDFRSEKAADLGNNYLGGIPYLPSGVVDRMPDNGTWLYQSNKWAGLVNERINVPTPVNLYLTSSYDAEKGEATAVVKAAFTQNVNKKVALTVVVIENDIIDAQEDGLRVDTFYNHVHVMRELITPTTGTQILEDRTEKEAGLVYERSFTFPVHSSWKPENCHVVAFLCSNESGEKEILQAVEAKMQP